MKFLFIEDLMLLLCLINIPSRTYKISQYNYEAIQYFRKKNHLELIIRDEIPRTILFYLLAFVYLISRVYLILKV